jgi:hypothetical protein
VEYRSWKRGWNELWTELIPPFIAAWFQIQQTAPTIPRNPVSNLRKAVEKLREQQRTFVHLQYNGEHVWFGSIKQQRWGAGRGSTLEGAKGRGRIKRSDVRVQKVKIKLNSFA